MATWRTGLILKAMVALGMRPNGRSQTRKTLHDLLENCVGTQR